MLVSTGGASYVDVSPRLQEVLELEVVRTSEAEVVAGRGQLHRRVRWAHVSDLPDVASLLQGRELVLTTGIHLPDTAAGQRAYIDSLADAEVAGVGLELGRRFRSVPAAMVAAARNRDLPLVVFHREVRFVDLTEAIQRLIITLQTEELRTEAFIHESFLDLTLTGASLEDVLEHVARLSGLPVVLENLSHRVLAVNSAGRDVEAILDGWEERSWRRRTQLRTELIEGDETWLVTQVVSRGEYWARLILLGKDSSVLRHRLLLERGAMAVTLHRLIAQTQQSVERETHRSLLRDLLDSASMTVSELHARAEALGVTLRRRQLVPCVVLLVDDVSNDQERELRNRGFAEDVAAAGSELRVPCLVGYLEPELLGVLVSLPLDADRRQLEDLAAGIQRRRRGSLDRLRFVVAAGSSVTDLRDLRRSFAEARQVALAAVDDTEDKRLYELSDVRLRGLLTLLRDDPRLQMFIERELAPLLAHDSRVQPQLESVLRCFLETGGNKSETAALLGLSRPALYQRLNTIEELLGRSLETAESRLSMHVALIALDVQRQVGL